MVPLLRKILANKAEEVAFRQRILPIADLRQKAGESTFSPRGFSKPIKASFAPHKVIAEIKRISPGTGFCRMEFDPLRIAGGYQKAGAAAISVLTDTVFFGGSLDILATVRSSSTIPLLRKDFITEPYQLYEARLYGADAVLIMAICMESPGQAADLCGLAHELGLEVLFEVHDENDMASVPSRNICLGINNRNFRDEKLGVDMNTTRKLAHLAVGFDLTVSESGIRDTATMKDLESHGMEAFLVGSAMMRSENPGEALGRLLGGQQPGVELEKVD